MNKLSKTVMGISSIIIIVLVIIYVGYTNYNVNVSEIDIYNDIEELLILEPEVANTSLNKISFYKPQGYKMISGTNVMVHNENYIEIISKVNDDDTMYTINAEKELIFEQKTKDSVNLKVWHDGGNRYEVLLFFDQGYGVAGNFIDKELEKGIYDLVLVLNSITEKEYNGN